MSDPSRNLASLLKKLRSKYRSEAEAPPAPAPADAPPGESTDAGPPPEDPVQAMVFSFLLWECSTTQARAAHRRLSDAFVDFNELRIALASEIAAALGEKYPLSIERASRLKAALHDVFKREHAVTLGQLHAAGKRESRAYLESLDGVPTFVSSRVFLLSLGGHALPVDDRLLALLRGERALPEDVADADEACGWLERQLRAGEAAEAASLLQAWSDDVGTPPKREPAWQTPPAKPTPARREPKDKNPSKAKASNKPKAEGDARPAKAKGAGKGG